MSVRTAARVVQQARLLDYGEAAAYLGMSEWQLRKRVAKGEVSKVPIPTPDGRGFSRSARFDVRELDRVIDGWAEVL